MKISKLKKICNKAGKTISFFYKQNDNSLWVGSESAMYPLYGMPNMNTSEQLLTLFDINEGDKENWRCKRLPPSVENGILERIDLCTVDEIISRCSTFVAKPSEYQIFQGEEKTHICPKSLLEVIDDYDILTYYAIDGIIIVKAGLLTLGVISEVHNVVSQGLLDSIKSMYEMLSEVYRQECEEKEKSKEYEQMSMTD